MLSSTSEPWKVTRMAEFADLLTYAHENRKFVFVRLIAPAIVVSLFLAAFVYEVEWQGHDTSCIAGQPICHAAAAQNSAS